MQSMLIATTSTCPLYMNLDSICYDPENRMILDVVSNNQSSWVSNMMTQYNTLYGINLTLTYNAKVNDGSDHRSFWTYGYPAVWMHSETYGPIHSEWDTIERVSAAYTEKNGQLCMSVLAALAKGVAAAPPTPTPTLHSNPNFYSHSNPNNYSYANAYSHFNTNWKIYIL